MRNVLKSLSIAVAAASALTPLVGLTQDSPPLVAASDAQEPLPVQDQITQVAAFANVATHAQDCPAAKPAAGDAVMAIDAATAAACTCQQAENQVVMYSFSAPWCMPCQEMKVTLQDEDVAKSLTACKVIKVNIDQDPATAKKFDVTAIPAQVFVSADGAVIEKIVGLADKAQVVKVIKKVTAKHAANETSGVVVGMSMPGVFSHDLDIPGHSAYDAEPAVEDQVAEQNESITITINGKPMTIRAKHVRLEKKDGSLRLECEGLIELTKHAPPQTDAATDHVILSHPPVESFNDFVTKPAVSGPAGAECPAAQCPFASQFAALHEHGLPCPAHCPVEAGGQTLPSPYYQFEDVHYYAPGAEFVLSNEARCLGVTQCPMAHGGAGHGPVDASAFLRGLHFSGEWRPQSLARTVFPAATYERPVSPADLNPQAGDSCIVATIHDQKVYAGEFVAITDEFVVLRNSGANSARKYWIPRASIKSIAVDEERVASKPEDGISSYAPLHPMRARASMSVDAPPTANAGTPAYWSPYAYPGSPQPVPPAQSVPVPSPYVQPVTLPYPGQYTPNGPEAIPGTVAPAPVTPPTANSYGDGQQAYFTPDQQQAAATVQVKSFAVDGKDANKIVDELRTLFGQKAHEGASEGLIPLRFAVDTNSNSLIAAGSECDLQLVESTIRQLEKSVDTPKCATYVYRLKNVPALSVANTVTRMVQTELDLAAGQSESEQFIVVPEEVTNSLIVSASPRWRTQLETMIADLDRAPTMVMVDVMIAEIDWSDMEKSDEEMASLKALFTEHGMTNLNEPEANAVQQASFIEDDDAAHQGQAYSGHVFSGDSKKAQAFIKALKKTGRLHVISSPRVQTLDNQEAYVQVGEMVQMPTGALTDNVTGATNVQLGPARNIGIKLGVLPRVTPEGEIALRIEFEKSELGPANEGIALAANPRTGEVIRSPRVNSVTAQTTVRGADGETIILGGLVTQTGKHNLKRVPLLAELPAVGRLFQNDGTSVSKKELLIILTPHIVKEHEEETTSGEHERVIPAYRPSQTVPASRVRLPSYSGIPASAYRPSPSGDHASGAPNPATMAWSTGTWIESLSTKQQQAVDATATTVAPPAEQCLLPTAQQFHVNLNVTAADGKIIASPRLVSVAGRKAVFKTGGDFAISVGVQVSNDESEAGEIEVRTFEGPEQESLRDFTRCRPGQTVEVPWPMASGLGMLEFTAFPHHADRACCELANSERSLPTAAPAAPRMFVIEMQMTRDGQVITSPRLQATECQKAFVQVGQAHGPMFSAGMAVHPVIGMDGTVVLSCYAEQGQQSPCELKICQLNESITMPWKIGDQDCELRMTVAEVVANPAKTAQPATQAVQSRY